MNIYPNVLPGGPALLGTGGTSESFSAPKGSVAPRCLGSWTPSWAIQCQVSLGQVQLGPLEGPRDRLGTILGRFGVNLEGGGVPGTSAGPSRGALFANLTFFASEADLGSILPLPRSLGRALWPPLGAFWAALVALGTPLWAPKNALWAAWDPRTPVQDL